MWTLLRYRTSIQPLRQNEVRGLLQASAGTALHSRWLIAATLGLRQGEALGLRWSDIDLEGGQLRVRQSLQRQEGGLRLVQPKTPRSRRTMPLPQSVVEALRAHKRSQTERREAAGEAWADGDLAFTTRPRPVEVEVTARIPPRWHVGRVDRTSLRIIFRGCR